MLKYLVNLVSKLWARRCSKIVKVLFLKETFSPSELQGPNLPSLAMLLLNKKVEVAAGHQNLEEHDQLINLWAIVNTHTHTHTHTHTLNAP